MHLRNQGGFSLIVALVSLAILSLVVANGAKFFGQQMFSRQKILSQSANEDVDSALTLELVETIFDSITTSGACIDASKINGKTILGDSALTVTSSPQIPGSNVPPEFKAAISRCASPVFPANRASASDNKLFFCATIKPNNSGGATSFMRAKSIFAEVYIELKDLQSGTGLSCDDFIASRLDPKSRFRGAMTMINLYWSQTAQGATFHHNRQGYVSYVSDVQ